MIKLIKYAYSTILIIAMPIIGYSEDNSFYKGEVNCNDNEKVLKIINKTKNENRIMCLEKSHPLHDYLSNHKDDSLKIESEDKN